MPGIHGQHGGIDADLRQCAIVFAIDVIIEQDRRIGRPMQPAIRLDFGFQLGRRPSGIAERQKDRLRAAAVGNGAQNVQRRRQANVVVDHQGGFVQNKVGRMKYESPPGFNRAAVMDSDLLNIRSIGVALILDYPELGQEIGKGDVGRGLVDDDAHGAFFGMGAHIDHRPGEAVVLHARHGDEKMAIKIEAVSAALHGRMVTIARRLEQVSRLAGTTRRARSRNHAKMTAIDLPAKAAFRSSRYDGTMRSTAFTILVAGILSGMAGPLPGGTAAIAAQSEWDIGDFHRSRLLLVPGEGTALRGGLEIAMEEGWHTYWRVPGDAGIPPQFDFSGSSNVADVAVSYPFPERYNDGSSVSLIYRGHVTLPLTVEPVDPELPVTLNVSALFGVCDVICIPAKTTMSVTLAPRSDDDPRARIAIEQARRRLPGKPQAGRFDVESAKRKGDNLEIIVRTPDADFIDLFAEGPRDWFLGQPLLVSREGAIARYRLPLEGMPEGETVSGRTFIFVAVAGGKAIEKAVPIK